jgi:MoaA/NifB/PqqE/SkfB family radical SAM enzyme
MEADAAGAYFPAGGPGDLAESRDGAGEEPGDVVSMTSAHRGPRPPGAAGLAGVKLELTHACNLRCDFCYTDSPRHTVARTPDLEDQVWREVTREATELGVIEAVLTGGEPLLRRELCLELLERLARAEVSTVLNTNGWFVDRATATRLAEIPGLLAQVSVDGATAELHDSARGVRGSWRRAIAALDLLLARGVRVAAVTVATPRTTRWLDHTVVNLGLLGVPVIRVVPVGEVGAAARQPGWAVDRDALESAIARAQRELGSAVRVYLHPDAGGLPDPNRPVRGLLIRPNGHVLLDSHHPFIFGEARDGLAAAWAAVQAHMADDTIRRYREAVHTHGGFGGGPVPYLDDEVPLARTVSSPGPGARAARLPKRRASSLDVPETAGDLNAAREHVTHLALSRAYRAVPLRSSEQLDGSRLVRLTESGRTLSLNATAAIVLDAVARGTGEAAVDALAVRYPRVEMARLRLDALAMIRWLRSRGVIRAATAPVSVSPPADTPGQLVVGGLP